MAGRSEASCCDHHKPCQGGPRSSGEAIQKRRTSWKVEGKLYQQDTGISIYVSRARFDIQFCAKRLSETMAKPQRMGNLPLARLTRYLVGTQKLVLRFDHQEYRDIVRIPVDSDWAGSEERYSMHAGLEFHGEHLVDSWVESNQVRALSSGEAELHSFVDGSARGIFTKHNNIDVESDSTAAIGMCSRTGVEKTRHIQVRWLWIQDAIRDKVVRLRKAPTKKPTWEPKTLTDRHISAYCRNCRSSQLSADGSWA